MTVSLPNPSRRQTLLALMATSGLWCAPRAFAAGVEPLVLPATPSELLHAPASVWAPLLARLGTDLEAQLANPAERTTGQQSELYIHMVLVTQAQERWPQVRSWAERARRLQSTPASKLAAGVLNELVADAQAKRLSAPAVQLATRERFAALPWDVVGAMLRGMQVQLKSMSAEQVETYVAQRQDLAASIAKGQVSLGFAMQLVSLRVQLLQVLPLRDALVAGLAEVIALHPVPELNGHSGAAP